MTMTHPLTRQPHFAYRALILFLAATVALTIAALLGMKNPFWAAMPVWVVAQAFRQDMLIRGALRFCGTVAGALAAWGILYHVSPPPLQVMGVGLILGLGTLAAYRIGTVYSYGALMTAMTVVVVVFPALDHPLDAQAYALDRILCTFIGVLSVTLLSFAFTPSRLAPMPAPPAFQRGQLPKRVGFAVLAGVVSALMVLYVSGPIAMAAGFALSVFGVIIGATRDNGMILENLVPGALIGVIAAVAYRALATWAGLSGLELVALAIPFIAAGAVLRCHPRTAPLGLDANMCFLLAAEAGAQGHPLSIHIVSGLALVCAATFVSVLYGGHGHRKLLGLPRVARG